MLECRRAGEQECSEEGTRPVLTVTSMCRCDCQPRLHSIPQLDRRIPRTRNDLALHPPNLSASSHPSSIHKEKRTVSCGNQACEMIAFLCAWIRLTILHVFQSQKTMLPDPSPLERYLPSGEN